VNDMERRRRMHREVSAYRTLTEHAGIPKLVDSNSEAFDDLQYKLYLVTELIDGATLENFVKARDGQPIPLRDACVCALNLLETVEYCHSNDVVHRDIKPANIVLRDALINKPVLVDFGLSFEGGMDGDSADNAQATLLEIELGNRFLRLRELGPHSLLKRDPRSDLASVAGIFFFLLTLEAPIHTGPSSTNEFAHQRPGAKVMLAKIEERSSRMRVERLFDRAFQEGIDARFQSAAELREAILSLEKTEQLAGEELIEKVKARIASSDASRKAQLYSSLQACTMGMYRVLKEIADELNMTLYGLAGQSLPELVSQGYAIVPGGVIPTPDEEIRFTITPAGTDMVFELSGSERSNFVVDRVPNGPGVGNISAELRSKIRAFAITKVRA